MSDAFEALADIRRWACDTLDASDAGKLCGMLSEVSRHANELEAENEKLRAECDERDVENWRLRELVRDLYGCGDSCTHCKYWNQGEEFYCGLGVGWKARRLKELGIEIDDERR